MSTIVYSSEIENIVINNQTINKLYKNNVLLWQRDIIPEGMSFLLAGTIKSGLLYSSNGKKWKRGARGTANYTWTAISYNKQYGSYMAGTSNGIIFYSDNGKTWIKVYETPSPRTITSMAYKLHTIASVLNGDGTTEILYSELGNYWLPLTSSVKFEIYQLSQVNFHNSIRYIAVTNKGLRYSTDGKTWENHKGDDGIPENSNIITGTWVKLAYNETLNRCVAYGFDDYGNKQIAYTDNGYFWTIIDKYNFPYIDEVEINDLQPGNNEFLAIAYYPLDSNKCGIIRSEDGIIWNYVGVRDKFEKLIYSSGLEIYVAAKHISNLEDDLGLVYSTDITKKFSRSNVHMFEYNLLHSNDIVAVYNPDTVITMKAGSYYLNIRNLAFIQYYEEGVGIFETEF